MLIKQVKDFMNKPTFDGMHSDLMEIWRTRVDKLHAEIRANPSAKFRDCEEDNQHPYWEPQLTFKKKENK